MYGRVSLLIKYSEGLFRRASSVFWVSPPQQMFYDVSVLNLTETHSGGETEILLDFTLLIGVTLWFCYFVVVDEFAVPARQ